MFIRATARLPFSISTVCGRFSKKFRFTPQINRLSPSLCIPSPFYRNFLLFQLYWLQRGSNQPVSTTAPKGFSANPVIRMLHFNWIRLRSRSPSSSTRSPFRGSEVLGSPFSPAADCRSRQFKRKRYFRLAESHTRVTLVEIYNLIVNSKPFNPELANAYSISSSTQIDGSLISERKITHVWKHRRLPNAT